MAWVQLKLLSTWKSLWRNNSPFHHHNVHPNSRLEYLSCVRFANDNETCRRQTCQPINDLTWCKFLFASLKLTNKDSSSFQRIILLHFHAIHFINTRLRLSCLEIMIQCHDFSPKYPDDIPQIFFCRHFTGSDWNIFYSERSKLSWISKWLIELWLTRY